MTQKYFLKMKNKTQKWKHMHIFCLFLSQNNQYFTIHYNATQRKKRLIILIDQWVIHEKIQQKHNKDSKIAQNSINTQFIHL